MRQVHLRFCVRINGFSHGRFPLPVLAWGGWLIGRNPK
jgi:hypothetical protein